MKTSLFTPAVGLHLLFLLVSIIVLVASQSSIVVLALTGAQKQVFSRGVYLYDSEINQGCASQGSTGPVTAGTGAPGGAAFPSLDPAKMAVAIDTWIAKENPNSSLMGLGSTIVAGAKNSNVNPFLIVTIAKKETSLANPSDYNVSHGNNSFGRQATSSQPNFRGSALWYRWTSVKASVDYTALENKGAVGGGDMAAYLRNQYSRQLDSNDLMALMQAYAPPTENDTATYIAQINKWTSEMIALTAGAAIPASPSTTSNTQVGCSSSPAGVCTAVAGGTATGNAALLCEAQRYDGIYYKFGGGHSTYETFRQSCPLASLTGAAAASTIGSPGPCATDCSGLVSVAASAAFGQNYNWTSSESDGRIIGPGAEGWKSIPISSAKPGDLVTRSATGAHVEIVDHVDGNNIYTFGSHRTGTKTGLISTSLSYWADAWSWTGPGSGK